MDKMKSLLPFVLLIIAAVPLVVWLVPIADPFGGLRLEKNADEVISDSRALLDSLQIPNEGFTWDINVRINRPLVRQTQEEFKLAQSNELLRTVIPGGYFWEVRWIATETANPLSISRPPRDADQILEALRGGVTMRLSGMGKILRIERKIPDTLALPSFSTDEAREYARAILQHYGALPEGSKLGQPASERTIAMSGRTDHEFTWDIQYPPLSNKVETKVLVSGKTINQIWTEFNVPAEYEKASFESAIQIIVILVSGVVIAALIVLAFRRFRSFEIGFRLAITVGIVAALLVGLEIFLSVQRETGWEFLLPLIFGPLFIGGALLLIWAVSESVGRETWNDKFISLDLLTHGHFAHSRVGQSVFRGVSVGLGAWAVWLVLVAVAGVWTPVWLYPSSDNILKMFVVPTPSLLVLSHDFYVSIYPFALFVLFSVSFLRRFIASPILLVSGAALILGLISQGSVFPLAVGIVIHVVVATMIIWCFYRYDALAAYMVIFTMAVARNSGGLWASGPAAYSDAGLVIVIIFGLLLVGSAAVQFRKKEITDFDSIVPVFAHHITERQRLQQELEIAREVQMSFLPKSDPNMKGLDIASRCVPALEVGGDYYDFVPLGPRQLGVAIGDVSGKGTQAAFYMTLAKGFLRALSTPSGSVSNVLKQINRLFYENVERGAFISMVYAVFETAKKRLRLTRAGHNPVLVWRAKQKKLEVIQPNGLALGLEDGRKFSKTIQEVKISFAKGDCFIFYTDGFTEAMNKQKEEYGEDRFATTVQNFADLPAKQILEGVFAQVKVFIGKAKQHDDMTLVVVKVV